MVVIVADPGFVTGDRTGRLDAAHQSRGGQGGQDVVHRLPGYVGKGGPDRSEDRVGVGVRMLADRLENRDAGRVTRRSTDRNCSAKSDEDGTRPIFPPFLESVKY